MTLSELLLSPEDIYLRRPAGSILRFVRLFGAAASVLMPVYFLALAYHHQGLLSSDILSTVISSRKLVFLPMGAEMIFLLLVFQLVREAGVRVPGVVGQTVGIIGGLILGQAAVSANFVSTVALIIVALTGLGNFVIPNYDLQIAVAYYRVALCLLAAALPLFRFTLAMERYIFVEADYVPIVLYLLPVLLLLVLCGMECVGRMAKLLFLPGAVALLSTLLLAAPAFDCSHLFPLFSPGFSVFVNQTGEALFRFLPPGLALFAVGQGCQGRKHLFGGIDRGTLLGGSRGAEPASWVGTHLLRPGFGIHERSGVLHDHGRPTEAAGAAL